MLEALRFPGGAPKAAGTFDPPECRSCRSSLGGRARRPGTGSPSDSERICGHQPAAPRARPLASSTPAGARPTSGCRNVPPEPERHRQGRDRRGAPPPPHSTPPRGGARPAAQRRRGDLRVVRRNPARTRSALFSPTADSEDGPSPLTYIDGPPTRAVATSGRSPGAGSGSKENGYSPIFLIHETGLPSRRPVWPVATVIARGGRPMRTAPGHDL